MNIQVKLTADTLSHHLQTANENNSGMKSDNYEMVSYNVVCSDLTSFIQGTQLPLHIKNISA